MVRTDGTRRNTPSDGRGRRIALVCHCLLNANSKVEGLAEYAGVHPLIARLAELGIGVIQMPCAEMSACGMDRPGHSREEYGYPAFVEHCARLADETLAQVREYQRCGYEIVGLVGVEGSPSCGVTRSASTGESGCAVPGVHISALLERLAPLGVRFVAIDEEFDGHGVDDVVVALSDGHDPGIV